MDKLKELSQNLYDFLFSFKKEKNIENRKDLTASVLDYYKINHSEADYDRYSYDHSKFNSLFGFEVYQLFEKCKECDFFEDKSDFALRIALYPYLKFINQRTLRDLENGKIVSFPTGVDQHILCRAMASLLKIPSDETIDLHRCGIILKQKHELNTNRKSYRSIILMLHRYIKKALSEPDRNNIKINFTQKADELFQTKNVDRLIAKPYIVDALNDLAYILESGKEFNWFKLYPHSREFDFYHFPQNIFLYNENQEDLVEKLRVIHRKMYAGEKSKDFAKRIGLDSKLTKDLLDGKINRNLIIPFDEIESHLDLYPGLLFNVSYPILCDLFNVSEKIEYLLKKNNLPIESFCEYADIIVEDGFCKSVLKTVPYYVDNYENSEDNYCRCSKRFDELLWDAKEYLGLHSILPLFKNNSCYMAFTPKYMEAYLETANLQVNPSFLNYFSNEKREEKEKLCQFLQITLDEYDEILNEKKIPAILGNYLGKNYFEPLFADGDYYSPRPYQHKMTKDPTELFECLQLEQYLLYALKNVQEIYKSKFIEYFNNPLGERTPQIMRSLSSNRNHIICLNKFVQSDLTQRENNILDAVYPKKIKYINHFAKDEADIWTEIDQEGIDGKYFEKYLYWEIDFDEKYYIAYLTISSAPILSEKETGLFCKNDIFLCADDVPWHSWADYISSVTFKGNVEPLSMAFWFSGCSALHSISWGELNTGSVTNMRCLFSRCYQLKKIDVSHLNTSNCEDMFCMFAGCHSLKSIDLSNFDTSKCKNMSAMFEDCGLKSIDVSHFDTSKCVDMSFMFAGCSIEELNLETFDMQCVEDVQSMFGNCYNLKGISFPDSFITQKIKSLNSLFSFCSSLQSINFDSFNTANVKYMAGMFYACSALSEIDLTSLDFGKVASTSEMFLKCYNLEHVKFPIGRFKQVKDMTRMFTKCEKLSDLDLSSFNTADNIPVIQMFADCKNLKTLKIPNLGMPSWRDITNMFENCEALNPLFIKASWTVHSKIREYFEERKKYVYSFDRYDYDDDYMEQLIYF